MTGFYHGGAPGLRRGDWLLPPDKTGAPCSSDYVAEDNPHRRDLVYVTTDRCAAFFYAAMYPGDPFGHVYKVEPVGKIEPDPDCREPGLSYQVPGARVLRRIRVKPKLLHMIRLHVLAEGAP